MGSNLLYKASIVTTPTAYGVGVLNSIKPAQSFSEELVTNGNFSNGTTDWSVLNGAISIDNNRLKLDGISGATAEQTVTAIIGRTYLVTYEFTLGTATSGALIITGGNYPTLDAPQGVNSFYSIATSTSFRVRPRLGSAGTMFVDNVSVVEVTDADFDFTRTSSATRVNPDYLIETVSINSANLVKNGNFSELGTEEVTNGGFETDTDWTKGAGITISGGSANFTGVPNANINQSASVFNGITYKITFTISNYVSGNIDYNIGGATRRGSASANGTYTDYVVSNTGQVFFFQSDQTLGFTGSIENVSIKQVDPNNNWTLGTGWSYGAGKVIASNTSVNINQNIGNKQGIKLKIQFEVEFISGSFLRAEIGGSLGTNITSSGTYSTTITPTSASGLLFIYGSSFTGSVTNISVIEIQENGVPRLDYTNGTASILLEPQSTNLLTFSNDLTNSTWSKFNSSVLSSATVNPEGASGANLYVCGNFTGSNQYFRIDSNATYSNDVNYTYSMFVKYNTFQFCRLSYMNFNTGEHFTSVFDIISGTVTATDSDGTPQNTSANIQDFGNGWFRISISAAITSSSGNAMNFEFNKSPSGTPTFIAFGRTNQTTTTNDKIYVFGAQLEEKSFATSYIPTSGQSGGVTRAAESLNNAGNSDLINSEEGTLYFEGSALANDGTDRVLSLSDGSANNRIVLYYNSSNNLVAQVYSISNNLQGTITVTDLNITENSKVAVKYETSSIKLYLNGFLKGTQSIAVSAINLSELDFDNGVGGANFYGKCKTVAVFKEALTDTELACLTSTNNREIFLNYYYRMQYAGANTEALNCAQQTFNV